MEQKKRRGSRHRRRQSREFFYDQDWSGIHICGQGSHCPSRYSPIFPLTGTDLSTAMRLKLGLEECATDDDSEDSWGGDDDEGLLHVDDQGGGGKEESGKGGDGQVKALAMTEGGGGEVPSGDKGEQGGKMDEGGVAGSVGKDEEGGEGNGDRGGSTPAPAPAPAPASAPTSPSVEGGVGSKDAEGGNEGGSTGVRDEKIASASADTGAGSSSAASPLTIATGTSTATSEKADEQDAATDGPGEASATADANAEVDGDQSKETGASDEAVQAKSPLSIGRDSPAPPPPPYTPINRQSSEREEDEGIFQSIRKSINRTFWSTEDDGGPGTTAAAISATAGAVAAAGSQGEQGGAANRGGGRTSARGRGGGGEGGDGVAGDAEVDGFARQRSESVHPKKGCRFTQTFDQQRRISTVDVELIISQVDVGTISHRQANSASTETVIWSDCGFGVILFLSVPSLYPTHSPTQPTAMHNMTGAEEDEIIPTWVYDAVWHNRDMDNENDIQRLKFFLLPHKDDTSRLEKGGNMVSILPTFQQRVLPSTASLEPFHAPGQVRATKVMKYLMDVFLEENAKKIAR